MVHYYGYNGIKYDVEKLWKITQDNPTITMDVQIFKKMINSKPWYDGNGKRIGPVDVVSNQDNNYQDHKLRIRRANMKYPILVEIDNQIVDGFHRIAKAYQEKLKQIPIKYVTPEQLHYALFDIPYDTSPKLVYGGSMELITDKMLPLVDSKKHGKVVFGSPFRWMTIVMSGINSLGKHWSNKDIEVGIVTEDDEFIPIVRELRAGAFDEFLSQPIYIYTIRSDTGFVLHDHSPSYCYYTANNPCEILKSEHIPNPKIWLRNALGNNLIQFS